MAKFRPGTILLRLLGMRLPEAAPKWEMMANGWESLLFTERVDCEGVSSYAAAIASILGAVLASEIVAPDIRMQEIRL